MTSGVINQIEQAAANAKVYANLGMGVQGTGGSSAISNSWPQLRAAGASARAIAETLAVEQGEITLDLPPSALGMLENAQRDNIYYSVRRDTDLVTGYPDLPAAPPTGHRGSAPRSSARRPPGRPPA